MYFEIFVAFRHRGAKPAFFRKNANLPEIACRRSKSSPVRLRVPGAVSRETSERRRAENVRQENRPPLSPFTVEDWNHLALAGTIDWGRRLEPSCPRRNHGLAPCGIVFDGRLRAFRCFERRYLQLRRDKLLEGTYEVKHFATARRAYSHCVHLEANLYKDTWMAPWRMARRKGELRHPCRSLWARTREWRMRSLAVAQIFK